MLLQIISGRKSSVKASMSFLDHLEALRGHLFRSFIAVAIGAVLVGIYNKFFIGEVLFGPTKNRFPTYSFLCSVGRFLKIDALCLRPTFIQMQSTAVSTQFSMFFTVILVGGIILAFPYIFFQFWKFIKPALTQKELKNTRGIIFWVSFLFFLGVFFGYFVIAPYTVNFFANFQLDSSIENRWTISSYIDLMVPLILGTGLAFQLPLVLLFLSKVNIISSQFLKAKRKHAIVIIFIVAAVITPPDVLSQIIVSLPLLLLYEISIVIVKRTERKILARTHNTLSA